MMHPVRVASDIRMMRRMQRKAQRRGVMPPPSARRADAFSMVGKPLITSFMSGMPPHIALVIAGHQDINTTMG
jgi:hypothetical protein